MVTAAFNHGAFKAVLSALLVSLVTGCVLTTQSRTGSHGQQPTGGNLIKPYIPPGPNPSISESPVPPGEPTPMAPAGTSSRSALRETAPKAEVRRFPNASPGAGLKKPELQKQPAPEQTRKCTLGGSKS